MKALHWIIAVAALAAVLFGVRYWTGNGSAASAHAAAAAPKVTTAEVLVRPVASTKTYTGRLQAVDTVAVRPRVSGYITEVDFAEGEMVHAGQLLFRIDPRPYQAEVDRLQASLAAAQSALELARANAARANKLIDKHYISRKQHDALISKAHRARAKVAAIRARLDKARLNLTFTKVRAPIDGRISNIRITAGNLVTSDDVLTEVVSVAPLHAYFDVDENAYLALLERGRANAHGSGSIVSSPVLMGLADEQGFPHRGHIDFVDNRVDAGSGTIRMRAVFANQSGQLVPGLFARLRLPVAPPHPTVLVAPRAIGTDLGHRFVYVVDDEGKASYRQVRLGPMFHGLRIVRSGLEAGERIVINGLQRVLPGQHVQAETASMDMYLSKRQRMAIHTSKPFGDAGTAVTVASR